MDVGEGDEVASTSFLWDIANDEADPEACVAAAAADGDLPAALVVPACVALREAVLVLRAHGAKLGGGTRAAPDAPPGYRPVGEPVVGTALG